VGAPARRNLDAFDLASVDVVVTDSGGCAAALRDDGQLLAEDPVYASRAAEFAAKSRDFSEVVEELAERANLGRIRERITYQDACQLIHGCKVQRQPRALIRRLAGDDFVEAAEPRMCCGGAGNHALTDPARARELRERKLDALLAGGATTIVSGNPGCLMHLDRGLRARGSRVRIVHLAQVLDEALQGSRG
jgi:glycolate oxidase iron-sulfur subunit